MCLNVAMPWTRGFSLLDFWIVLYDLMLHWLLRLIILDHCLYSWVLGISELFSVNILLRDYYFLCFYFGSLLFLVSCFASPVSSLWICFSCVSYPGVSHLPGFLTCLFIASVCLRSLLRLTVYFPARLPASLSPFNLWMLFSAYCSYSSLPE